MRKTLLLLFLFTMPLMAQTSNTGRVINGLASAKPGCSTNLSDSNAHNGDIYNDVDDQNTFKCSGGVWITIGGGASIPFTTIAFSATPSFSGTPISAAYSITLTGNVTSSTVSGVPTNGNIMKLHICQGAGGPWTFSFPANFLNTTTIQTTSCTDETYNFDGTNWSQLTQPVGGAGGGGASVGAQGTIQAAGTAGAFQTTNVSESGGVLTVNETESHRGPNPAVDVTAFNARAVNPNSVPATTGTITGGTNSLAVASATGFQKNDGIAIVGSGAANCATAPAAPTGVPSLAASGTGTGYSVAGATGTTSVSYAVVAISKGGCYTAASPVLTISNSFNSLGANTLPITSQAISGGTSIQGTVTVTLGSTANLANGAYVRIGGTTDDFEFGGYHIITVISSTQFTYDTGESNLYAMASTSATGGTLYYWTSNHITLPALPAGTNMYKEAVYRCIGTSCALPANAANYSLVWISYPLNLGFTDATYGTWDDYGTTMTQTMNTSSSMWFVPATPPSANVNDMLATSITNISGTTFTLAVNATNSVTSSSLRIDNTVPIAACVAASNTTNTGGGGSCHVPPPVENSATGNYCYVTSSYLVVSGNLLLGAPMCVGETIEDNGQIIGTYEDSVRQGLPQFAPQPLLSFSCIGANPCIWRKSGGPIANLSLTIAGPSSLGIFDSTAGPSITHDMNFQTDTSVNDYMSILYYYYDDIPGSGTFGGHFTNTSWTSGPAQVIGATSTPIFISKNGQEWVFDYVTNALRGFYFEANSANTATQFIISFKMGEETQGPITPLITLNNGGPGGNRGGHVYIEHVLLDSGAEPLLVNASSTVGTISAPIIINGVNALSTAPTISGNHLQSVFLMGYNGLPKQIGVNTSVFNCGQSNSGCHISGVNKAIGFGSGNHTLVANEGGWVSTGTGTVTVDCTIQGQEWVVYSQTGTTTLACNSGTLYGNGSTGSFVISNGNGVVVDVDNSGNAHATGAGVGSCSPGGTVDAILYNGGAGSCAGLNAPIVAGDYIVHYPTPTNAAVPPARDLPGVPVNAQTGTTYVEGSANYQSDRGFLVTANNAGAQTYTMGNPSAVGFGFNYFSVLDNIGTGAVTENASGFSVNSGSSFVTPSSWLRWLWSDGINDRAEAVPTARAFPPCLDTGGNHYNRDANGNLFCGTSASGTGLSGMTAGQVPIAATATTITSSEALAGAGAGITTGPTSSTSGDAVQFTGTGGQIADSGILTSNFMRKDAANTVGAFLTDWSAATWKVPTSAGFTAGATTMLGYDSTNKNLHVYQNNADAINCAFASTPVTGDLVSVIVTSGTVLCTDSGIAATGSTVVVANKSDVTNQSTSQSSVTIGAVGFRIQYYASQNALCTTGANSVSFTFNWTDAGGARSLTTGSLTLGSLQTASGYLSGVFPVFINSGNATYTSTVSGSCASGTSSYDIHVKLEKTP